MDDTRNSLGAWLTTAAEAVVVALAVTYVVTRAPVMLIAWEVVALLYIVVGFLVVRRRSLSGRGSTRRVGILDTLSWVLPLVASIAGLSCALDASIVTSPGTETPGAQAFFAALGAGGTVLAWVLLHAGFAQVYESRADRDGAALEFPGDTAPDYGDYLYFSFTVGTSFAASDTLTRTRRTRWIVLVHSVVSFFYNAVVVATAIQVFLRLASVNQL